jgi:hypothetical protein
VDGEEATETKADRHDTSVLVVDREQQVGSAVMGRVNDVGVSRVDVGVVIENEPFSVRPPQRAERRDWRNPLLRPDTAGEGDPVEPGNPGADVEQRLTSNLRPAHRNVEIVP